MDLEKIREIQNDGRQQAELSRRIVRHTIKYAEYYEYHKKPLVAFFLIGVAGVLGIAIPYLNGWVFSLALGVLTLLILAINSILTKHRRRKRELDVKGFLLPTKEQLQSYQDAVDFFDYVSSTAERRFSPVVARTLKDAAVKKITKGKSERTTT